MSGASKGGLGLPGRHCLNLHISVDQQFMGEVPGGYRVDLHFSGEPSHNERGTNTPLATIKPSPFPAPLQDAIDKGRILSGTDWATINSRAVIELDSRITIALRVSDELECPMAGRLRGRARLHDVKRSDGTAYFTDFDPARVFSVWEGGFEEDSWLPLVLSASFEVPTFGFGPAQTRMYESARELGDSLFIGTGKAIFRKAPYGAVKTIDLELYRPGAQPGQAAGAAA
jgi:hypothetical protein